MQALALVHSHIQPWNQYKELAGEIHSHAEFCSLLSVSLASCPVGRAHSVFYCQAVKSWAGD